MDYKYIAVNNDHGWGKGQTIEEARKNSLSHGGRHATLALVWEIADQRAYVDDFGTVYGVKPETKKEYRRKTPNSRKWMET